MKHRSKGRALILACRFSNNVWTLSFRSKGHAEYEVNTSIDLYAIESDVVSGISGMIDSLTCQIMNNFPDQDVIPREIIDVEFRKFFVLSYGKDIAIQQKFIELVKQELKGGIESVNIFISGSELLNIPFIRCELVNLGCEFIMDGSLPGLHWPRLSAFRRFIFIKTVFTGSIALVLCNYSILRSYITREMRNMKFQNKDIYALHPGLVNRTRHLWEYLRGRKGKFEILMLGRCLTRKEDHKAYKSIAEKYGIELDRVVFVRPLTLKGLWRICIKYFRFLSYYAKMIKQIQLFFLASVRITEYIKQLERILRGLMHAEWVQMSDLSSVQLVVFGHTGTGDTAFLEHELRARGIETAHWLHGISTGNAFVAYSDYCLCNNSADVALMNQFSTYKKCLIASPKVELNLVPPKDKGAILIVSNLIHPDNPYFQRNGIEEEKRLLRMVSNVSNKMGSIITNIQWRPHPILFEMLPQFVQPMREFVKDIGMTINISDGWLDKLDKYDFFISTISTTIIDLLRKGVVPVVYAGQPFDSKTFAGTMPEALKFRNTDELLMVLTRLMNKEEYGMILRDINQNVGISGPIKGDRSILK